jgi:hypothetical protein
MMVMAGVECANQTLSIAEKDAEINGNRPKTAGFDNYRKSAAASK